MHVEVALKLQEGMFCTQEARILYQSEGSHNHFMAIFGTGSSLAKYQGLAWVPGKLSTEQARRITIASPIGGLLYLKWVRPDLEHGVIIVAVVVCACLMPPCPSH